MKRTIFLSFFITNLTILHADDWDFLPILDSNYRSELCLAVLGGNSHLKKDNKSSNATSYGVEVSLNCPLIKLPDNIIKQHGSIIGYSKNNIELLSFELNPYQVFEIDNGTTIGAGPSFGLTSIEIGNKDDTLLTYGLGGSIKKEINDVLFIGLNAHYLWTSEMHIGDEHLNVDLDNLRILGKIGYQF